MFHELVLWLTNTIGAWGYPGIILLMALESSFFPFPSEVVVPPAAYLAASGKMNIGLVIASGTFGSLLGALFNYWLAMLFGRPLFEKYGRYFFVSQKSLDKADLFFERHGYISTFIGRLLPGIRQYISLPAGLAKMNIALFSLATAAGAGIWVLVLAGLGYWLGKNEELLMANLRIITICTIGFCITTGGIYWLRWRKRTAAGKGSK